MENINQNDTPIDIWNSLDHVTFHALYFSQTALELSFHAFHISQERTTREIEQKFGLCFVLICLLTPWLVIIWLHFDFSDCLLLEKSLNIWSSEILDDLGYILDKTCQFRNVQFRSSPFFGYNPRNLGTIG